MSQRVRDHDWTKTPLGDPADWPENLRTSLSLCLSSRFPILIWWGPDMRILYNDAYIPFLGPTKHPHALGQAGAECWREIWDVIGPMLEGVYQTGEATWSSDEQYFFDRRLPREEVYVTFTYGPILAPDGVTVHGIFCPCTETTGQVVNARRLNTLRKLSTHRSQEGGVQSAADHVCAELSSSLEDVPFAAIFGMDGDACTLLAATGLAAHAARAHPWPLSSVVSQAQPLTVELNALGLELSGGAWKEPANYARLIPLRWSGGGAITGVMILGVSPRRPLDEAYLDFLELVARHSASAIGSAAAYEQESRRAAELAKLDRAKTAFFSNVSHEFRTPLTLILGPLEAALEQPERRLDPKQLQMLHRNAVRLQKLVNTVLDFSRLEAGRLQARYEPIDLGRVTADHASIFRSAIEAAGLRLVVDCDAVEVYVAPDLYEKIVLNLLSNAFKYTMHGEIAVTLRDLGQYAALTVRDTGTGIPESEQDSVFERFHRVEGAVSRTHEGTGIGLTLVRELVKLHGGHIDIESQPGEGSAFTVTLLKGSAHLPAEHTVSVPSPSARNNSTSYALEAAHWTAADSVTDSVADESMSDCNRPCVLYADDNADMRDFVRRLLSTHYDVRTAPDGKTALESIQKTPPDLVISDVMMPGLDGLSLLQALRTDDAAHDIPVILLSARAGEEARIEGMQAGADDYLVKPFSGRELIARVSAHLRLSRLRQETLQVLRDAHRRKDEFLAMLAHELRNPLAPMHNGVHALKLGAGPHETERIHDMLQRQVSHMRRLVDDLLEIARINNGKISLHKSLFDVSDAIHNAVETSRAAIDAGKHTLEIDLQQPPLMIDADPVRLAQMISNLLNNAAKYTREGGRIRLSARRESNEVVISVADNGVGIAPDKLSNVFDLFTQLDDRHEQGGLGIGLTLVRNLAQLHGGRVQARSDGPGQGSEFVLRLPMPVVLKSVSAPPTAMQTRSAGLGRILVVDDNQDVAETTAMVLETLGAQVLTAADGREALSKLDSFEPHVMLLDIGMPGMSGYEVARRVRAGGHAVLLIAMTGWGREDDLRRSASAGFDHHIVKPMDFDALEQLLASSAAQRCQVSSSPPSECPDAGGKPPLRCGSGGERDRPA